MLCLKYFLLLMPTATTLCAADTDAKHRLFHLKLASVYRLLHVVVCARADVGGPAASRQQVKQRLTLIRSHRRVSSARSTTRCTCVLATVAMATAPAAATVPVRRQVTSPRKPRPSRVVPATKRQPQRPSNNSRDVASAAAAATPRSAVRRRPPARMLRWLDQAPSDLRHGLGDCARRPRWLLGRRRREAAIMDRPTAEQPAASSRTSSPTSGRCRSPFPANRIHRLGVKITRSSHTYHN